MLFYDDDIWEEIMVEGTKIYLAGDIVFRPNANFLFYKMKEICKQEGYHGISPFDGQSEVESLTPGFETCMTIAKLDRDIMDKCDIGIFCIDPFRRAADMDPGTAVEIGYMAAQGKRLEGYTTDARLYPEKVLDYISGAWKQKPLERHSSGGSGSKMDADEIIIHSEGCYQNAMVDAFINMSGGTISVNEDILKAFTLAVRHIKNVM